VRPVHVIHGLLLLQLQVMIFFAVSFTNDVIMMAMTVVVISRFFRE